MNISETTSIGNAKVSFSAKLKRTTALERIIFDSKSKEELRAFKKALSELEPIHKYDTFILEKIDGKHELLGDMYILTNQRKPEWQGKAWSSESNKNQGYTPIGKLTAILKELKQNPNSEAFSDPPQENPYESIYNIQEHIFDNLA